MECAIQEQHPWGSACTDTFNHSWPRPIISQQFLFTRAGGEAPHACECCCVLRLGVMCLIKRHPLLYLKELLPYSQTRSQKYSDQRGGLVQRSKSGAGSHFLAKHHAQKLAPVLHKSTVASPLPSFTFCSQWQCENIRWKIPEICNW